MRISDYYAKYFANMGVKYVFGVTGSGTAVQMFDSIAMCDGINYVCTLHEQAGAMAADGYARISGGIGVAIATSGPGVTNLVTGIAGAFYDSIPVIYIVGQAQTDWLKKDSGLRHFGYHETDVIELLRPITKYVVQINDPSKARYELEKAVHIATTGRKGPVVLCLPDDITWLEIEPEKLEGYIPEKENTGTINGLDKCINMMLASERPILMIGAGVRLAGAGRETMKLIELLKWPVALTYPMRDFLPDNYEGNIGSFGMQGSRGGNFAVQNSDFILSIGARLDPYQTGSPASYFARGAKVVSVDVDRKELDKYRGYDIPCDLAICCDAKDFIKTLVNNLFSHEASLRACVEWKERIERWRAKYPICLPQYFAEEKINPYVVVHYLSEHLSDDDIIITDTSTPRNYIYQSFRFKKNQRLATMLNFACLGYGLPGAIGACFATYGRVISFMGDGGLQLNIQELATAVYHNLNLKIFLFDNDGYSNIQKAQDGFLGSRYEATDREHGLPLPDSAAIAGAYGLPTIEIYRNNQIEPAIQKVLGMDGPVFCSLHLSIKHGVFPVRKGRDPLENMTPHLDQDEFLNEMIITPII